MSAVFSTCLKFRYRLERVVQPTGVIWGIFGVNPSKAGAEVEDQTTNKWRGFALRNGCRHYIVGNPLAACATDVRELRQMADPVGPHNDYHLRQIIAAADVLVPCWGNRNKLPKELRHHLIRLKNMLVESGKPIRIFGLTKSGDPMHPLMLGYNTVMTEWKP